MSCNREAKQWSCGKPRAVNLQRVTSMVREIGEPCLSQSPIKVSRMLKREKWQATFDGDGKVSGFRKVLKSIVLGVCCRTFYILNFSYGWFLHHDSV
ncbi:hypothetical protein LINPERHAP1_LOCUS1373 [Linum perenne]